MNLSNLFGKQVFALYEGEIIGTVMEVNFNANFSKVTSLKLFDLEENEYELKFTNVKALNECVIINNKTKLSLFLDSQKNTPMFKTAISENAKTLGKVIDCIINEVGDVEYFLTDTGEKLESEKIYLRKNFVYYSALKFTAKNLKPKNQNKDLHNIKINILTFENNKNYDNFVPSKVKYNTDTILGKVAKNTLFGVNNEIIIKANDIINQKTIDDATRHNRLNQLYFIAN